MADSDENKKEDGPKEYTPLTEPTEDETTEKNIFRVKGHLFRLYTFKQPTFCALCEKFVWGCFKQGYSCKECRMAVHRRCYANVFGKCRTKEENDDNDNQNDDDPSKPHTFEVYSFKTPTFCCHCGSLIYGLCSQGLKCKECKQNVHHRCKTRAAHVCGIDQKAELMKMKDTNPEENEEAKDEGAEGETKEDDAAGEVKEGAVNGDAQKDEGGEDEDTKKDEDEDKPEEKAGDDDKKQADEEEATQEKKEEKDEKKDDEPAVDKQEEKADDTGPSGDDGAKVEDGEGNDDGGDGNAACGDD